jgi:hypothetical protein
MMGIFRNSQAEQENALNEARHFLLTHLDSLPNHYLKKPEARKTKNKDNAYAYKARIVAGDLIEEYFNIYLNIQYDEFERIHKEKFRRKTKLEVELPRVISEVIPLVLSGKEHRIKSMIDQGVEVTHPMQRLYAQRAIAEQVSDGIGNPYLDSGETNIRHLAEKYLLELILDYLFDVYRAGHSKSYVKYTNDFLTLIYVHFVFLDFGE